MKMFLVKRKMLTLLVCLLAAGAMFIAVNHPAIVGASAATRQLPIYCVQRDQKMVAISFDAAWGNEDTQQLIDILAKYKVTATFFVVGDWVEKFPESVKALHDAGHEVMNHSDDHAHFTKLSKQQMQDNINACNDKIEEVTGVRPTLFRPPYGEYDDNVVLATRDLGMEPIQWDVEGCDIGSSPWGRGATLMRLLSCKRQNRQPTICGGWRFCNLRDCRYLHQLGGNLMSLLNLDFRLKSNMTAPCRNSFLQKSALPQQGH